MTGSTMSPSHSRLHTLRKKTCQLGGGGVASAIGFGEMSLRCVFAWPARETPWSCHLVTREMTSATGRDISPGFPRAWVKQVPKYLLFHRFHVHQGATCILATGKGYAHFHKRASGLLDQSMEKLNECETIQLSTRPSSAEVLSPRDHVQVSRWAHPHSPPFKQG